MRPEDRDELQAFVAAHSRGLLATAFVLTGNRTDAEDLLQEGLERLAVKWKKVSSAERPDAYARRVIVNLFTDGYRRRAHRPKHVFALVDSVSPDGTVRVDESDALRRALMNLPVRQRATIVLSYLEGLSHEDIAELMRCSTSTVRSQLSRGLTELRGYLQDVQHPVDEGPIT